MPALLLYSCFCILLQGRVKPGNKMEKYLDKCDTAVRQGNYSFKLLIHLSKIIILNTYQHRNQITNNSYQVEKTLHKI